MIDAVFAGDGDSVKENDLLINFDTRTDQVKKLKLQLREQKLTYESRIRAMQARKRAMESKYKTNKEILARLQYLLENGALQYSFTAGRQFIGI